MAHYAVRESPPLRGEIPISTSKNAVLPIMCGALLTGEDARIERVPELTDVKTLCALLALLPVLLAGARLIVDYSAQKDYPTSAISVYHILSLVVLSLFFLNEGKFAVGKGSPASYLLFGSLSVVLLLVHALPSILLSAFWVLPMNDMDLFSAVDIACAAYILVRMASLRPASAEGAQ